VAETAIRAGRGNAIVLPVLCVPILGASLLAKFGIPPLAELGFGIALPLLFIALAVAALNDRLRIDPKRLGFYCVMVATLSLPQLLRAGPFSEASLLILAVLHFPYVLILTGGHERIQQVVRFYLTIAAVLAGLALAQYFLQTIMSATLLFPIDNFVPTAFLVQGFNDQSFINYGSNIYRATGVFMLEPSFLTQFLAVAIVLETLTSSRLLRIALYAGGIVVAHAGTGLLILMICLPILIVAHRRWDLLLYACLCLAAALAAADVLNLNMMTSRVNEFSDPHSSGFARFVGGFYLFEQMLWPEPARALFGYGAGGFMEYAHLFELEVADMPLTKMVFEFGVVGAAVYFTFLFSCLFSSPLPRVASLAVALTFLLNGMYVPFSHGLALSLLVLSAKPRTAHPAQEPRTHAPAVSDEVKLRHA
jgi:hypothetical protein